MEELINFISKDGLLLTIAILILIAITIFDFLVTVIRTLI